MPIFVPKLQILPPSQRQLWQELSQVPADFVLYGDTALALRLGHRQSIDFDFFGNAAFNPATLRETIPFLASGRIQQQAPNTLTLKIHRGDDVKVSFFGLPGFRQLQRPEVARDNGLKIASLLDLAATKAAVVQQRAEAKDYIDVDAILRDGRINLPIALVAAQAIYGQSFNPQLTLKALSYFGDDNLRQLSKPSQDRLAAAARSVNLNRLPSLTPELAKNNSGRGFTR